MCIRDRKRTEDAQGNITAKRVGTMVVKYDKDSDGWENDATYEILYGDITQDLSLIHISIFSSLYTHGKPCALL